MARSTRPLLETGENLQNDSLTAEVVGGVSVNDNFPGKCSLSDGCARPFGEGKLSYGEHIEYFM